MDFIEVTSSGKDFRRVGDTDCYFGFHESGGLMEYTDNGKSKRFPCFTMQDFFRDDWEFVEREIIEVGDVVGVKPIGGGEPIAAYHRRVLSIHDGLAHLQGNQTLQKLKDLKLIRKKMV